MGKAYLILENGAVFEGRTFGYEGEATGELVFNTGMTGYLETLTDPSYYGQIVMQTFPLIGNYGVIPSDFESSGVRVKAYIVREWCQEPSNFRSEGELDTFLRNSGIPGLYGLDTRTVTKIVRESGVMNAKISRKPELTSAEWQALRSYSIRESVEHTSTKEAYTLEGVNPKYKVALWDFGAKGNIARELTERGCTVTVLPWNTTAGEIKALKPDGIMLTNG
ncbi:MAG: carbamoyl phosphate synthase small subunit, partial [Clostridiales bacterium]|nr:carbamoyl phosphate synthase small subunit [Clostridiales bacterium]